MASWWAGEVETVPKPTPMIGYKWSEGFVAPFQGSGTAAIDWALDCVVSLVRKGGRTDVQPIETIECVDIGCGDGRVAVAAARRGFHATGIDIDDTLLMHAAESARISGVPDQCVFLRRNLLEFPEVATDFDVIFLYLLPDLLKHHADVNDWLWAAVFVKRCILVTMRWQLQDTSTTPWSTLLVATNTEGIATK